MSWIANNTIVPLVRDSGGTRLEFLGTGCFIAPMGLLLTAHHVVGGDEDGLFVVNTERPHEKFAAAIVATSPAHDLAVLWVEGYRPKKLIRLAHSRDIRLNQQVICFEYGGTEPRGEGPAFSAATRLGNVTRVLRQLDWMGPGGVEALELSFPALRGASGAPIFDNARHRLWGVVSANVAHHLMPAQVERVVDEQGVTISEVQFMMPQAVAVNVRHVRDLLGMYSP